MAVRTAGLALERSLANGRSARRFRARRHSGSRRGGDDRLSEVTYANAHRDRRSGHRDRGRDHRQPCRPVAADMGHRPERGGQAAPRRRPRAGLHGHRDPRHHHRRAARRGLAVARPDGLRARRLVQLRPARHAAARASTRSARVPGDSPSATSCPTAPTAGSWSRSSSLAARWSCTRDTALVSDKPGGRPSGSPDRAGRPRGVRRLPAPDAAGIRGELGIRPRAGRRRPDPARSSGSASGSAPAGPGSASSAPIMGFGVFVMMQRQMLGIRARAGPDGRRAASPVTTTGASRRACRPTAARSSQPVGPRSSPPRPDGRRSGNRVVLGWRGLDAVGLPTDGDRHEPPRPTRRPRPVRARPGRPAVGHPAVLRHRRDDGRRHQPRGRGARLRHAAGHRRGRRREPARRPDPLHQQPRHARAAARAGAPPRGALRRRVRPGDRDPGHGRRVRGGRPRAPGDLRPGRRGHPPRAVVRRLRPGDRLRRRRRAPRRDPLRGRLRARPGRRRGGDHAADQGALPRLPVQPDRRRPAGRRRRRPGRDRRPPRPARLQRRDLRPAGVRRPIATGR